MRNWLRMGLFLTYLSPAYLSFYLSSTYISLSSIYLSIDHLSLFYHCISLLLTNTFLKLLITYPINVPIGNFDIFSPFQLLRESQLGMH